MSMVETASRDLDQAIEAVGLARGREDIESALDLIAAALADRPGSAEAIAINRAVVAQAPGTGNVPISIGMRVRMLLGLANTLRRQQLPAPAEHVYEAVIGLDPAHAGAMRELGYMARAANQHAKAAKYFEDSLALRPDDNDLREDFARTLLQTNRLADAESHFRKLLEGTAELPPAVSLRILLGLADTLRRLRRLPELEEVFATILELDPAQAGIMREAAVMARGGGDHAKALELFQRCLALSPGDRELREEEARTFLQLNKLDEAATRFQALLGETTLESDSEELSATSIRILFGLGNTYRRQNKLREAETAYQSILEAQPGHAGALRELGIIARNEGDYAGALAWFERGLDFRKSDQELREDVARTLIQLNRLDEAEAMYRTLLAARPADARLLMQLAHLRRMQGDSGDALNQVRAAAASSPHIRVKLEIEAALRQLDQFDEADAVLQNALAENADHVPLLTRLGITARDRGEHETALNWFTKASAADPEDAALLFEVAASLRDLQRGDEADAVLARLDAVPDADADERLRLLRLEYYVKNMQFDVARQCLATFDVGEPLPTRAVLWAAALHAATGEWDEILRLFEDRVVPGRGQNTVPANDILIEAVGKATRARARQEQVIQLIGQWASGTAPLAANLREQLVEELELLHAFRPGSSPPAIAQTSALRQRRSARIGQILLTPREPVSGTVILCTDHNYLPGAIVALASVLRNNLAALRNCRFCFFLSEDAMPVATPMVERIAAAYDIAIESLPAWELGHSNKGFKIEWGFFALGHRLSDAAYYRILAALWLAGQPNSGRVLYLDSDVCAGPGLADLLRFDLSGRPLAARLDQIDLPGIRQASRKLGILPETYFNSGVLLIDLTHEAAVPGLKKALQIATDTPERLSFVDQCALNLAFHGQVTFLPDHFNLFVRQKTHIASLPREAPVTHYLGRPKSWDPAYPVLNGAKWLEEFAALADILTTEQLRYLLAIPFGGLDGLGIGQGK